MAKDSTQTSNHLERSFKRSYVRALRWVILGWMIGIVLLGPLLAFNPSMLPSAMIIAIGSVAIACLSMIPAFLVSAVQGPRTDSDWSPAVVSLALGMMIRVTGTVALFLTCRYHMATPTEMIAGMTIGWYLLLTSLEVIVLARELPKSAKTPNFPGTTGSIETPAAVKV